MQLVTFKNSIRLLKQQIKADVVPFLHGIPGIGKSSIVKQIVIELAQEDKSEWGLVDFRAALYDQVDVSGYPTPDLVLKQMKFLPPALLPTEKDAKNGIFFVDELTKGERGTQNALFQLILDKKCNEYILPKGWKIMVAGNLGDEDQTMINDIDAPLANRMSHWLLKPDHKEWIEYMGADKLVSQFIDNTPQFFARRQSEDGASSSIRYAFPTPRTLDMLQRVIDMNGGDTMPLADMSAHATSLVGSEAATSLISFISLRVKISGEDICENLSKVKGKLIAALKEGKNGYATMEAAIVNFKTHAKQTDPLTFIVACSTDTETEKRKKDNRRNNILEFIYEIIGNDKFGKREMAKGIFEDFFNMTYKGSDGKNVPRNDFSSLVKTKTTEYRKIIASRPEDSIKPDVK